MATATKKTKEQSWTYRPDPNHTVVVIKLWSGKYLGSMGLNPNLDPSGANDRSESFETVEEALHFVGWPSKLFGIPAELK